MSDWYNYSWMEAMEKLESNEIVGLDSEKVEKLQEQYGKNRIFQVEERKQFPILKKMILSPWVILLIISSVFMIISENYVSGALLLAATILSDFLYNYDELIKIKNVKQLEKIDNINASVLRGGKIFKVPAEDLVIGDIVFVEKGVSVPADLRIFECKSLKVKQTSVTGESYLVEKYETMIEESDISLVEMKNMLFKSSIVMEGMGAGVVTAIGADTEVGKIVKSINENDKRKEKYKDYVKRTINILELVSLINVLFMVGANFVYGIKFYDIITKISLVLCASLPLALIMMLGLYFQLVKKFYKRNGIEVKKINSIETAGKIDMIIAQKIGFFSEKKMDVVMLYTDEKILDVSSDEIEMTENIDRMIKVALLCNNNSKNNVEEKALIEFGKNSSYDKYNLDSNFRRMFEVPFDMERGIKTTVNKIDKKYRANVVGAVDKILEICKYIMKDGVETEITEEDIEKIKLADIDMSTECLNVTGFAYRNFKYLPSKDENIESYLVFVGLIGFINPLKDEAVDALKESEEFGIGTLITSEDSKLTSISVGNNMGIKINPENVLCGIEIENMEEQSLKDYISKVKILSRLTLKEKLRAINALEGWGHNIMVTGMNLTDLPLLKAGNFRVAFSESCSSTLKATSDAYMNEENYDKLIFFVNESKRIYYKFLQLLKYFLAITLCQGMYILLYCSSNKLELKNAFYIYEINLAFVILSFIYFSMKNRNYSVNKIYDNKVKYKEIIIRSIIIGAVSFLVSFLGSFGNEFVNSIVSLAILPIMELIFINRKFNVW